MNVVNAEIWQKCKDSNPDEPDGSYSYGSVVNHIAEQWADAMEAAMANGETLEQCADRTFKEIDAKPEMCGGITGFQYGCVIVTLRDVWAHGKELNAWHNTQYGAPADSEGTVNPAILTIGP